MIFDGNNDNVSPESSEPPPFIDAHTHSWLSGDGVVRIRNIFPDAAGNPADLPELFSIGIHPGNIDEETFARELDTVRAVVETSRSVAAIGECGLDHFSVHPLEFQEKVFVSQLELSLKHRLPLVIHAVRSWHDIIRIKNEYAPDALWMAHGFRSSQETADELISHNIMLSFGEALINDERTRRVLENIPDDSFLLETDESVVPIQKIYQSAAVARDIELENLRHIVKNNFDSLFRKRP